MNGDTGAVRRAVRSPAVLVVALLSATACQLSQLAHVELVRDDRLSFSAPAARSLVHVPLTIAWTMHRFEASGLDSRRSEAAGEYAVFVDLAPIGIGRTLRDVGKDDPFCVRDPSCPGPAYLRSRGVYVTTDTSVTLTLIPKAGKGVGDEQHVATVVLLDGTGVRRTESAWHVEFRYPRRSS